MNNSENRSVKKDSVYEEFILWTSMPPTERHKLGIETQQQFSEYYGISINTPTAWKKRNDFKLRVSALRKEWAFEKTSIVLESILRSAVQGKSASQKLWLQYFHNFPKEQEREATEKRILLHHNDLRFMIDGLPPDYQVKFYGYLREIMDTVGEFIEKGSIEDSPMPAHLEDRASSLTDPEEMDKIRGTEKEAKDELERLDALPLSERGMADIIRRGI